MFRLEEIIILILVLFSSFGLTFIYKKWAIRRSILDVPNERSLHETPVPRGGGIAIVITFYSYLVYAFLTGHIEKALFFALLPGIVLAAIGIIDDFKSISPLVRLSIQFVCAGVALYFLSGFDGLFGIHQQLLWSAIMIVGIVWFVNLFNFQDGSDGCASMEAIFIAISLWIFSGFDVLLILGFSVGGFLFWNWPKARIFMGDVGSTVLGFVLVVLGVYLHNEEILVFHYFIILSALFWFDSTITLFRRIAKREKIGQAHKNHIYQRAIRYGFSHQKTLVLGLAVNLVFLAICFLTSKDYINWTIVYTITLLILWMAMRFIDVRVPHK